MSEPARELPAEQPTLLAGAVDDARRRGVITHLTIGAGRGDQGRLLQAGHPKMQGT